MQNFLQRELKEFEEIFPTEGGDSIYRFCRQDYPPEDSRGMINWLRSHDTRLLGKVREMVESRRVPDINEPHNEKHCQSCCINRTVDIILSSLDNK